MMRTCFGVLLAWMAALVTLPAPGAPDGPARALVVTGGHEYPTSFYTVFEQEGLAWDHAVSNEEAFRSTVRGKYDVVVLYDMSERLSREGQRHFREFVENGGGVVALHHAIVSGVVSTAALYGDVSRPLHDVRGAGLQPCRSAGRQRAGSGRTRPAIAPL